MLSVVIEAALTGIAGGFAGWIFARRKLTAEARKSELDTVEQAVTIWRNLAKDLETKLEDYRKEIESLRSEINKLHSDNQRLIQELKRSQKTENRNGNTSTMQ